jgi:hypothetical protein
MATVFQISQMERTLADGGVIVCHWRANASETVGEGDDAVTYSATNYGTAGFTPDPSSSDWVDYDSITEDWRCHGALLTVLTRTLLKHHWRLTLTGKLTRPKPRGFRGKPIKGK